MPRPTLSLRVSSRMVWPKSSVSSSCWRTLKTPVLPSASPSSSSVADRTTFIAVVLGSASTFDFTRPCAVEVLADGFERIAAGGRQRRDHVERHHVAAGGDVGEL